MLDLSFSTYYGLAKLQIVHVENKYNPIAYATYKNVAHFCSGVGVIGIPLILSSHHHCPISTE